MKWIRGNNGQEWFNMENLWKMELQNGTHVLLRSVKGDADTVRFESRDDALSFMASFGEPVAKQPKKTAKEE